VVVEGVGDLMTHMARCCKPVPYDALVGFITLGRGVTVHRGNCLNIQRLPETDRERLVQVRWSDRPAVGHYPVDILVIAADRKGLLRDISSVITNEDVDVIGVNSHSDRSTDLATLRFTLEIADIRQLSRILSQVGQVPEVIDVRRQV
jgi:GTP pyrophosphokinase